MKIASLVGARPQFIKLAPLIKASQRQKHPNSKIALEHKIIHTGQHYDYKMDKVFFDELGIPEPDYTLEVGSGSHGWQTGEMMKKAEEALVKEKPDLVIVYGDTNSTLAGALASSKLGIPIAHVESGLRSYNRNMSEEVNRILADRSSDFLFCPTENACENLGKEGFSNVANNGKLIDLSPSESFSADKSTPLVINVGDIMYDAALLGLKIAETGSNILERLKLEPKKYYLATVHRAENSDDKKKLKSILDAFTEISIEKPIIFPVHPRTKKNLEAFHLAPSVFNQIQIIEPVSYFDMLILEKYATKILTDSGGMQKEAYFFKVPCVTLRDETEWVETLEKGNNVLTGADKNKIIQAGFQSSTLEHDSFSSTFYGDGQAADRILGVTSYRI
ncbi:MAG: UDP-N-acetyl glucosamine 2-epimerase [Candidatus Aminicenantes bacterium]|nr:MAG: UDP-N-acetyl glucosamine 2-epimerase [Candidatus Aminicenantes bacterium]